MMNITDACATLCPIQKVITTEYNYIGVALFIISEIMGALDIIPQNGFLHGIIYGLVTAIHKGKVRVETENSTDGEEDDDDNDSDKNSE